MNTNGGGLSCVHPGMYGMFLIIEAVTQLRRQAGERQLAKADVALLHGNGGTLSSQVTALPWRRPAGALAREKVVVPATDKRIR
ncbi:thiolase [Klebsiella pneumoniae]|nr:thiolase [Klebsiella pneumoniae]